MENGRDLREGFERDGFVHLRGFLSPEETDALEATLERFVQEVAPRMPRADAMYEDYDDPTTLKQLVSMHRHDEEFARLLHGERFRPLAEELLAGGVVPQGVEAFVKPAGRGTPTPPHQDGYYFCLSPNEALTFWIPLGDIDEENGALCYARGSHRLGVQPHHASNVLGFSQGLVGGYRPELGERVACPVRRGDVLAHHSLTVHFAPGNPTPRPRRALALVYYSERARLDEEARRRYFQSLERQRAEQGVA